MYGIVRSSSKYHGESERAVGHQVHLAVPLKDLVDGGELDWRAILQEHYDPGEHALVPKEVRNQQNQSPPARSSRPKLFYACVLEHFTVTTAVYSFFVQ